MGFWDVTIKNESVNQSNFVLNNSRRKKDFQDCLVMKVLYTIAMGNIMKS